ncbi:hypothetical protein SAMN02910384_01899 [Pseudobutyrivibrio sp. ACV-2]|uniref:DUF5688 family protein n=1 Tax=Pseudobutyrivibrio sp. ACV-2 TaxID=1520801 RepID=UPI0008997814|nr:DUF5688 family protein [Pseudobutyrivibrio sp. ACV-2]SEA60353.1 hypothetical protein SAMN02910384_01899 [Pseudobutyrivibrio sp. ACV-2]
MMDYEQFKEQFKEDLKMNLEAKGHEIASVDIGPSQKLNQGAYDAISVKLEDSMMGPSGNFSNLFAAYEKTDDYDLVLNHATRMMDDAISNMPSYDANQLTDYDFIKDKLVLEAVNAEKNSSLLEKVPHKDMEDIAIVYRVLLGQMDDGIASVVVTNEMLEKMDITKEQLHQDALISSPEIRPVEVNTLFGTIAELIPDAGFMLPAGGPEDQILVGTVADKHHGAGVIAYEGFLDEQAKKMGEDFYIIPCSIHEVLLVPESMAHDIDSLKEMISNVNSCELEPEDILSDNLYHYDSKEKVFELAENFKERIATKEHEPDKEAEKESAVGKLKKTQDKVKEAPKKEHKPKSKDKGEMAI